jgi:hypothetical protein
MNPLLLAVGAREGGGAIETKPNPLRLAVGAREGVAAVETLKNPLRLAVGAREGVVVVVVPRGRRPSLLPKGSCWEGCSGGHSRVE